MYHSIVRAKVRKTFAAINRGDHQYMVEGLASEFSYTFHGAHALSGTRTSRVAMLKWWERVERVLPGATFDVRDVVVAGTPWSTRVVVRSKVTRGLPQGAVYENMNVQFMILRWGRVVSIETFEDSALLARALLQAGAAGDAEALAPPIIG